MAPSGWYVSSGDRHSLPARERVPRARSARAHVASHSSSALATPNHEACSTCRSAAGTTAPSLVAVLTTCTAEFSSHKAASTTASVRGTSSAATNHRCASSSGTPVAVWGATPCQPQPARGGAVEGVSTRRQAISTSALWPRPYRDLVRDRRAHAVAEALPVHQHTSSVQLQHPQIVEAAWRQRERRAREQGEQSDTAPRARGARRHAGACGSSRSLRHGCASICRAGGEKKGRRSKEQ